MKFLGIKSKHYSQFKMFQSGNKEIELYQDNFISTQCNIIVSEEDIGKFLNSGADLSASKIFKDNYARSVLNVGRIESHL